MSEHSISREHFEQFQDFFYRQTGIRFEASKRYFVDRRLIERIEATECRDFGDYLKRLGSTAGIFEIETLTNLMTVNETYFMREEYQFECLVECLLPELTRRRARSGPLRLWCIPSSTGEEPYSIAMMLMERWPELDRWDIELHASDIDTQVLARAQEGRYSTRSVQNLPAEWLQRHFRRIDGEFQISEQLRRSVSFSRVNLASSGDTRAYRDFDVIFCRNLLIYFDEDSRRRAVDTLHQSLVPGGFLCLGHSESLSRVSSRFAPRKFPKALVYQKSCEAE
jgi:chemotaxis protein methyltransferase CheR